MQRGYNVEIQLLEEEITDTDAYGAMLADTIFRGIRAWVGSEASEWKNGSTALISQFNAMAAGGATTMAPGVIGRLGSAIAGILILTATAGTPAAAAPATMTVTLAKLANGFNVNWLMGPSHRKIPWRFDCMPYLDTTIKLFTAT